MIMWHFNYLEWLSSFILPVLFSLSFYSSYVSLALLNFIPATFYISFQALVSLPLSFYVNKLFHKYRRPGPATTLQAVPGASSHPAVWLSVQAVVCSGDVGPNCS